MNYIKLLISLLLLYVPLFSNTNISRIDSELTTNIELFDGKTNVIIESTNQLNTNVSVSNTAQIISNVDTINKDTNQTSNTNKDLVSVVETHIEDGDFSPKNIFKALLAAYPTIVKEVKDADNPYFPDLAIKIRDTIFYNVNGRFLPEEERDNWKKYSSNTIYLYAKEIPNPSKRTKAEIATMKKQGSASYRKSRKSTYYGFNEKLYGMESITDTNNQIVKTKFLNKQVLIHQFMYEALMQVEKEIYALTNDFENGYLVRKFLKEGSIVYSFFWRTIAGSKSRSLHSYGVAVDVLEENSKKATYWLWRQNQKIDWIREPICVRWNPPDSVVKIFEKYGFVWGGKWNFYDTMHFEYKPEILLLNGYDVTFLNQTVITNTNIIDTNQTNIKK